MRGFAMNPWYEYVAGVWSAEGFVEDIALSLWSLLTGQLTAILQYSVLLVAKEETVCHVLEVHIQPASVYDGAEQETQTLLTVGTSEPHCK